MRASINTRKFHRQLREYLRSLGWVLRDGGGRFARPTFAIALVNLVGVVTGAVSLGGIVALAKHAGQPEPIRIAGMEINLADDIANLLLYATALAIIGLLSGLCLFATERMIMSVTRRYEKFNGQRILRLLNDPQYRGWTDLLQAPVGRSIGRLLGSGSRYTAYALRDMLRAILPIMTFVFAVSVLFWIDVWITLALAPVVIAYLLPLYFINLKVARIQQEYRTLGPQVRRGIMRGVRDYTRAARDSRNPPLGSDLFDSDSFSRFSRLHYSRMLASKRVHFLNTIFAMLCLLALITYFSIANRMFDRPWSDLLAYVIALRFTVTALRSVSTIFVLFSRFLPEYRGYAMAVEGAQRMAGRRNALSGIATEPDALIIKLGSRGHWGSSRRITLNAHHALLVLVPWRASRCDMDAIAGRIENRLAEPFQLARSAVVKCASNGHDVTVESASASALLLTGDAWQSQPKLSGRFTIIIDHRPALALNHPAVSNVVVMDERKIIGGGDVAWFKANIDAIRATLESIAVKANVAADDEDEDDDLDEEFG